ncbi:helix-turn-helix domain-containing protein [Rhizobium sp. BR 314]|uniref:helix-turn-helix domain-containing protein n=1 Tax=Rhizobium sp. BR 314 TaxID=3040013 RepID=UPI0039BF3F35
MTPFGEAIRKLRLRKGVSQKQMASALNVTPAYLSALEHGKRGTPTFDLLQRIAGYFNIIWDEAEELFLLARFSDPRIVVDTSGLSAEHTAFVNHLAVKIRNIDAATIQELARVLENAGKTG